MKKVLKKEVITFKVDSALADVVKKIKNRSDFIRSAILAALDHTCPLCRGTGILTSHQMEDLKEFFKSHKIQECSSCNSLHIKCEKK